MHLTDKGKNVAQNIYEKNQIFKNLLIQFGVDAAVAERDAGEMAHAVSAESFSVLKRLIGDLGAQ